ncbi:hypothetical protein KBX06_05040 [Micromonospora sp. C31]|uniref:hypothetical protein n=1 Tax=Micromonospora sp. C31 TaxID=2824876 RepID=UPI001B390F9E|nr:hypothetical protein [Micromonospora sp. C31]MBQ1072536.1 hypothetical protein [Micromonospora sp. C31]
MATFHQDHQHVHQNQLNADTIDLRNSTFERLPDTAGQAEVVRRLELVLSAVEQAAASGTLDPQTARSVAGELRGAVRSLADDDHADASERTRTAIEVLQAAAPLAAIGGALATIWSAVGGGS